MYIIREKKLTNLELPLHSLLILLPILLLHALIILNCLNELGLHQRSLSQQLARQPKV